METHCDLVGVVDVPPARRASTNSVRQESGNFVQVAHGKGIPCFEPSSPNAAPFVEEMAALAPDLFMAVGYMLRLKTAILAVPRVIAANFHASLLPAYRGKHPVFWALRNAEPWCGLTVHEMSPGLDTGDILFQVRVPTREEDSVSTLYDRIMGASVPLVPLLIDAVARGRVPRIPQSEARASYYGGTSESDFLISWSMEAMRIARWVTATPGQCFVDLDDKRFFLLDARASGVGSDAPAGTLLDLQPECCRIAAARGSVELRRVRRADGTEICARDMFPGGQ
jgi:methionyl-tRNA formyltransferase